MILVPQDPGQFTKSVAAHLVRAAAGTDIDVRVESVRPWTMSAQVATRCAFRSIFCSRESGYHQQQQQRHACKAFFEGRDCHSSLATATLTDVPRAGSGFSGAEHSWQVMQRTGSPLQEALA